MTEGPKLVSIADVRSAATRLDGVEAIRTTPVEGSTTLGERVGAEVRLKFEHLQKTGSFKPRGAYNRIAAVDDGDRVVAASAGNHAQGVALAATQLGVDSLVFMPETAPQAKVDATQGYGAAVELVGETFQAAVAAAREAAADPGSTFVHAYDDPAVIAGQGTVGLEIAEQVPEVDTVVVPIGGGGLISGVATALTAALDDVRVIGVQADTAATVPQSLDKGEPVPESDPDTIADGIATGAVSELTLAHIRRRVDEVVTVTDTEIAEATLFLLERTKQLVEGAGAAAVAPLLSGAVSVAPDETVVPIICGGNVDVATLQDVLTRALVDRHKFVTLRVRIDDRPGELAEIAAVVGEHETNIRSVRHDRSEEGLPVGKADLVIRMIAPGQAAITNIVDAIETEGYTVLEVVPT